MIDAFLHCAERTGFVLPSSLQALYRDGRTVYGPEWPATWRQRMLEDPPALVSVYDFEWNDANDIDTVIDGWLHPQHQHGRRFFPFGQSGAGDQYCLTPLADGQLGVALVWHDQEESRIAYPDFDAFIAAQYIATMADLGHLLDHDFTAEEAHRCLLADVRNTSPYLPQARHATLQSLALGELRERPYRYGPKRMEAALSLIAQDEEERALQDLCIADPPSFPVVARWKIG
jgi:hypothetical protein